MTTFEEFGLTKPLKNALHDLGFETPTPIQQQAFSVILSGKDVVGIAQTGTGKTLAYMLPILQNLKYSDQFEPRVLILVPTRELVLQVQEMITVLLPYTNLRVLGVYGGANINMQKKALEQKTDILVGTPGRIYDLVYSGALVLKSAKKLVIDEVDVMLDLGFRFQLNNIFDKLPAKRQNIMFSATMTEEVDELIDASFITPVKISIAISGTPLENIEQSIYQVENFYTKVNLLKHLIQDKQEFRKVLVFVTSKKNADRLFLALDESFGNHTCIIHANKEQNYRLRSVEQFDMGLRRIMIATDVMARGLDLDRISHVINFDVPIFPENYMHRIGRTGRASQVGKSLMFYTEKETESKEAIEELMGYSIPVIEFPAEVEFSHELTPEERTKYKVKPRSKGPVVERGAAFHEKKEKNRKENVRGKDKREMQLSKKYKSPISRGDKIQNKNKKKRK